VRPAPAARPISPAVDVPAPAAHPASEGLPTREELTLAWGDNVLPALRPAIKIYVASGRFVSVDDAAVYAVPDRGLLTRAQAGRQEVEAALAAHFGRPVPLRLVLDEGEPGEATPAADPSPPDAAPEDPTVYNIDEMEDAPAGVLSPEQRLLEAFPGAEEVSP